MEKENFGGEKEGRQPESEVRPVLGWEKIDWDNLTPEKVADLKSQINEESRREQEVLAQEQREYNNHRLVIFEAGRKPGESITKTLGKIGFIKENPNDLKVEPGKVYDVTVVEEISKQGGGGSFQLKVEEEIDPDKMSDQALTRYNNLERRDVAGDPEGSNVRQLKFEKRKGRWGAISRDVKGSDLDGVEYTAARLVTFNEAGSLVKEIEEGEEYLVVIGDTGREIKSQRGRSMPLQQGVVLKAAQPWVAQPYFDELGFIVVPVFKGVKKEKPIWLGAEAGLENIPEAATLECRAKLEVMMKIKSWEKGQQQERDRVAVEFIRGFKEAWEQAEKMYCEGQIGLKEMSGGFCRFEWQGQDYTFDPYVSPSELGEAPGFFVKKGEEPGNKSSEEPVSEHPYFQAWEKQKDRDPGYLLKTEIVRALMNYSQEDLLEVDWGGEHSVFDSTSMKQLVRSIQAQQSQQLLRVTGQEEAVEELGKMEPESNIYLGTVGLGNGRLKGSLVFSPALLKKGAEYLIRYVIDPEKTNLEVGSDTLHSKLKARIKKEILDPLVRELSQPTKEGEQLIKMGGQNEEVEEPSEDLKDLEQLTPEPADLGVVEEEEVKGGASEESRPSGYRELKLGELTDDEYGLAEGCAGDVLDYAKYDLDISFSVQEGNKTRDDLTQLIAFERQYNPGGPVAEIIQKEDRHLSEENCAVIWKFYQGEEGVTSSADSSSQEDEDLSGEEIGAGDAPEQPAGEDKSSVEVPAAPPSADALADLAAKFGRGGSSGEGKKSSKKKKKKK